MTWGLGGFGFLWSSLWKGFVVRGVPPESHSTNPDQSLIKKHRQPHTIHGIGIFTYMFMVDFYVFCTSPMDAMAMGTAQQHNSATKIQLVPSHSPPRRPWGLLDFGLVAQVPREDRDIIVSAVVHLGRLGRHLTQQSWQIFQASFWGYSRYSLEKRGGGNSNMFYFHSWRNDSTWRSYFSIGLKPPTSKDVTS